MILDDSARFLEIKFSGSESLFFAFMLKVLRMEIMYIGQSASHGENHGAKVRCNERLRC